MVLLWNKLPVVCFRPRRFMRWDEGLAVWISSRRKHPFCFLPGRVESERKNESGARLTYGPWEVEPKKLTYDDGRRTLYNGRNWLITVTAPGFASYNATSPGIELSARSARSRAVIWELELSSGGRRSNETKTTTTTTSRLHIIFNQRLL